MNNNPSKFQSPLTFTSRPVYPNSSSPRPKSRAGMSFPTRPHEDIIKRTKPSMTKPKKDANPTSLNDDYIKNLQQQVYLLELETRYLRSNPKDTVNFFNGQSATLNETFRSLKLKYIELQEKHKKDIHKYQEMMEELRTENTYQSITISNYEKEKEERRHDLKVLKEKHAVDKDKLYGENIKLSKSIECCQADLARMQMSYGRIVQEKEKVNNELCTFQVELGKMRTMTEEQLRINNNLKQRLEETHRQREELQTALDGKDEIIKTLDCDAYIAKLKELEQIHIGHQTEIRRLSLQNEQQEELRKKMATDCAGLVKSNTELCAEMESLKQKLKKEIEKNEDKTRKNQVLTKENEKLREEMSRVKDDLSIARISLENKEEKVNSLSQHVMDQDKRLHQATEERNIHEERIQSLNDRITAQENELIQLGQDKNLLVNDVSDLTNQLDIKSQQHVELTKEKALLQAQVDKFQRTIAFRGDFEHLVKEVEHSGQNYMNLVKHIKECLPSKPDEMNTSTGFYTSS